MHPKDLLIRDFTYALPDDKIAKFPLPERDHSKLLIYSKGGIDETIYYNLPNHLFANTNLVFNNTRVIDARLLFRKHTGAVIEVFCLEPHSQYADIQTAMAQKGKVWWRCLIGGASKWKHGMHLQKIVPTANKDIVLEAAIIDRTADNFVIEFTWQPDEMSFAEVLHLAGNIPLPPYLHRQVDPTDKERYQTVFAKEEGSVAAPTAGLHFTSNLLQKLADKGITTTYVTLHVGAGTFKPVSASVLEKHDMHAEFIDVSLQTIENLNQLLANDIVVAVGTTSLRTIETLYWMGVKCLQQPNAAPEHLIVEQWDPYNEATNVPAHDALEALATWMKVNDKVRLITKTQILIAPGYKLKIAKGLLTNFHQPQSTLLLLIAAIVGNKWKDIYNYALQNDFRFLSYGDACLLWYNDGE